MTFIKGIVDLHDGNYINVQSTVIAVCSSEIPTPLLSHTRCRAAFLSLISVSVSLARDPRRVTKRSWKAGNSRICRGAHAPVKN